MKAIVFWYNAPTVHQFALIRELATRRQFDVTLVTAHGLLDHRRKMGLDEPDFGAARRVHMPTHAEVATVIRESDHPDALHIFSGIHAFPMLFEAFKAAIRTRARVATIAIQPEPAGVAGRLRLLHYWIDAKRFGSKIDVFLALGERGAAWFTTAGFAPSIVYPFANFTDPPRTTPNASEPSEFTAVFVGELLERKRLDVLLVALAGINDRGVKLRIVGDGSLRSRLFALSTKLGLTDRVEWLGFQPHAQVNQIIAEADLLVLPSSHDGWGAVINEALVCGVPVICTENCGAAGVVRASAHGAVVRPDDPVALRQAMISQIDQGKLSAGNRATLAKWSRRISASAGADYLTDILDHAFAGGPRPTLPWSA